MGVGHFPRRLRPVRRDRDRSGNRRDAGKEPLERRVSAVVSPSPTSPDAKSPGPGTERSFSGATARSIIRPRWRAATPLSNRVGAGLDPCGALQTRIELAPNETTEIVFFLGEASTNAEAVALITRYRTADLDSVLRAVTRLWDDVLGTVQVRTPDRAMDILLNRWLLYQTLSCRVWARAACYQVSGAYGFRDQLQDVMALSAVEAGGDARTSTARGCATVCRGRRSALVASAVGPGRPHAHLRRPDLAGVRRRPLRRGHRR